MSDAIAIKDLEISFGSQTVLNGIDLDVHAGEFVCLLGPSGCGKSTILRILGELVEHQGGDVKVQGKDPSQSWKSLAYVFQSPRLAPWHNALENVVLGLRLRYPEVSRREARERAAESMRTVGIEHLAEKPGHVLSGGEQQRVSIARALAVDPDILLMDEPFSALDIQTRLAMRKEIRGLWRRTGVSVVFVTHDIDEALSLGSRIIVFSPKPTRILADLSLDFKDPVNSSSPEYLATQNKIMELFREEGLVDDLAGFEL